MRTADRIFFRQIRNGRLRAANGHRPTHGQDDMRKGTAWHCWLGTRISPASTSDRASSAEPVEYLRPIEQNNLPRANTAFPSATPVVSVLIRSDQ